MGVDPEKGAEFMAQLMSNETDHLQALNALSCKVSAAANALCNV